MSMSLVGVLLRAAVLCLLIVIVTGFQRFDGHAVCGKSGQISAFFSAVGMRQKIL
jgi:hypothetical protein